MLVHKSAIAPQETDVAVQRLRDQINQYVYPVYRLDRPTSGVLLFAFTPAITHALSLQWQQRLVKKSYTALVRGHVKGAGLIDYPLMYQYDDYADAGKPQQPKRQAAVSEFMLLQQFTAPWAAGRYPQSRYSLLNLHLWQGRKHQLRRHMAHFRHPIIGDTTHGDGKQNAAIRQQADFHQLALSCTTVSFFHPIHRHYITVQSPVHQAFSRLLQRLGPYQAL